MAEAFLQIVLTNLESLIKNEIGSILGADDEMKKLSNTLTTIQEVLQDAEDKQLEDIHIRNWLRKLKDLSYEIDDILDECATEMARLDYQSRKSKLASLKKILYKRKIGRRVKEATKKLDDVAAEREKFHLKKTTVVVQSQVHTTRETGSVLNEIRHVYGREEEKEKIVNILVNQVKDHGQLFVLPIVGVGGLGKTTFAQLVFNDKRVIEHFDVKLWVCVSDNFDQKTLIKAMIESTSRSGEASTSEHPDSLQRSLLRELNQKRYLLVMDDVWNESQDKWFHLKDLLECGSNGSSIIVTTRLKKVADIMSTNYIPSHYLKGLPEEHCWSLFKGRAFDPAEGENIKLEAIGKLIVKKCAGVPLAAKALGGLLRFKRKEGDWLHVKESEIWSLPQEESTILPVLRLSYQHLPFALRHCFAYCAVFPKDTWIPKEELILQWIAHGYISSNGEMEDIGDGIFNELVLRSLFQNVEKRGGILSFQMHDLVHDLAQSIMDNRVPGGQADLENRCMSNNKIRQVDLLRNFIAFPTAVLPHMDLTSTLAKFSRLRILDASDTDIDEVPSAIGSLKRVRYLNFSRTRIRTLPDALCDLWNLKILNLDMCFSLESLPKSMSRLQNLRHLFLDWRTPLIEMPPKIGEMTSLKTLNMFIVSQRRYNHLGELQDLDLGDSLCIKHLERVEDIIDANKANIRKKKNLHELTLVWERDDSCKLREITDEKVLEALEPHPNVKSLVIREFQGRNFPRWMGHYSCLENLVSLYITGCPNCPPLPQVIGELPCLESLSLYDLTVEYIVENKSGGLDLMKPKFPCLKSLDLSRLPHLKGLMEDEGIIFPILVSLNVHSCGSFTLPQLPSLNNVSCGSMSLTSFIKLDNLTSLIIRFHESVNNFPMEALENLTNLNYLRILDAGEHSLPEEGLRGLESLKTFDIRGTDTLTCLPGKWFSDLTAPTELEVHNCTELTELPEEIKCLQNVTVLFLNGLPKMVYLPNALQHLLSLQSLDLCGLVQLTSLPDWFGNFASLGFLGIEHCIKLGSFPACMKKLTKLRRLIIVGCPELWRRCEKGKGEDWHKISHVPCVLGRRQ